MSEFDKYSGDYKNILENCISGAGDSHVYFSQYKADYLSRRVIRHGDNYKLLDFGCGVGILSDCINNTMPGIQLDGYDISSKSISEISEKLTEQGVFTNNLNDLPGDYNVIVISNVMHHIPPCNRMEIFSMLKGLLAHKGEIVVIEHNPLNPLTRRIVDKCPFDEDAVLLPRSEVLSYFSESHMRILHSDYIVFFPALLKFMRFFERYLAFVPIGAQYVVVGEKN